jgi:hypothetical protein
MAVVMTTNVIIIYRHAGIQQTRILAQETSVYYYRNVKLFGAGVQNARFILVTTRVNTRLSRPYNGFSISAITMSTDKDERSVKNIF